METTITAEPLDSAPQQESSWPLTLVYVGLVLFMVGYYNRPEDFLGGRYLPLALIGGILSIGGYFAHLAFGGHISRTRETTILALLFCWLILSIPFSNYVTGSFQVFKDTIGKVLLLTIVMANAITSVKRLRRLVIVQAISVALMGSIAHDTLDVTGRVAGKSNSFGNANDLAVLLCINIPLLFYLLLEANGYFRKAFYVIALLLVFYTVTLTYSRTGMLALIAALATLMWHYGIKVGHHVRVIAFCILVSVVFLAFAPSNYGKLVATIFSSEVDLVGVRTDALESKKSRQQLLNRGIELTLEHPLFGVGLNGFEELSGSWHVQHNTYLQYSTEAGIPALILFLLLIRCTFVNLRGAERLSVQGSEVWRLAGALRASFWAFLVGAFFTNFGYLFFAYFIFGFAAAIHQIAVNHANATQTNWDSSVLIETSD